MPMYRGRTADGSDMEEIKGIATASPCGRYWTTEDLTQMTRKERREYWRELSKQIKRSNESN